MKTTNKFELSLKKYPLLPEQEKMLENIVPMLRSEDVDTINFVRQLIINEPLLDIIVGIPNNRKNSRTLQNRVAHCKYKKERIIKSSRYYFGFNSLMYVQEEYYNISLAIEETLRSGFYYMYG